MLTMSPIWIDLSHLDNTNHDEYLKKLEEEMDKDISEHNRLNKEKKAARLKKTED